MTNNKYNPQKAKELYNQVTSISKIGSTEEEFYNKLNDPVYAEKVYDRFKTKYNANLLGASDRESFMDSLGVALPELKPEERVKPVEQINKTPQLDSLKITAPQIETEIPQVKYTPRTPNTQIEIPNSLDGQQSLPLNTEQPMSIYDIVGRRTPQQRIQAEINELGEDATLDAAKVDVIEQKINQQLKAIDTANEKFLKEYESILRDNDNRNINLHHDSWSPAMPWNYKKKKKDNEFISANSARYQEIQDKKAALMRQADLLKTYKQYAEFGRGVEIDKRLSSMVSNGEISEDTMKILRSNGSEKAKEEYLTRLYEKGEIDKDTVKEIYNLGDLTKKGGFGYGLFKTGRIEDMLTFGMNEIARATDITEIAKRYQSGQPITDEEQGVLDMYMKLGQIKEKAQNEYGFGFNAGMGLQNSLRFVAEMALTGGVSATGKQLGVKGVAALIEKYGLKRAASMVGGRAASIAGKSALKQAALTPISPSAYRTYADRITGLTLSQDEVGFADRAGALWDSYAETFAERFSETLGNIASDIPFFTLMSKGKATKDITNIWVRTLAQMSDNKAFKASADALKSVGIAGIPEEILSELSGTVMTAALTLDPEALSEFTDWDFYKQVALQSAIMGGAGAVMNYSIGGLYAANQNKKLREAYDRSITLMRDNSFINPILENLKQELSDAMARQQYVPTDASSQQRSVADILNDMNTELENSAPKTGEIVNEDDFKNYTNDKAVLGLVDNAVRTGAYRYGEQQAIKSYVESKIGEFENEDGNVYEVTDSQGNNYFLLDSTEDTVVLVDRATGVKNVRSKNAFTEGSIKQTDANSWAMNQFLLNINKWNQQDVSQQVKSESFIPATHIDYMGNITPVKSYNPETGTYTITDEGGNDIEVSAQDEGVTEIWGETQQPQGENETPTQEPVVEAPQEETPIEEPEPVEGINPEGDSDVPQEEAPQEEMQYDEQGEPIWTSASVERGKQEIDKSFEEEDAKSFVSDKIKEAEKAIKAADKKAPKSTNLKQRAEEVKQIKAEREAAKANLDYWNAMAELYKPQPVEEAPVVEQPIPQPQAEQTTDVPVVDDVRDNPTDARARGYRLVNGVRYDRQQGIQSEVSGAETDVKFAEGVSVKGRRAIIDATELQPSHIGRDRNPKFFINEAQPKDRTDDVSVARAERIAQNIRPEEIAGGATAYTGSPVVNARGEVIQGNNRSAALKQMYQNNPQQAAAYKQYLIDHATEFGLDPQTIAAMQNPILVDVIDVTDEQAIQLGQRTAQDIESGGEHAISAPNVAQGLGSEMKNFAGVLFRTEDEDISLDDLIAENGYDALKWLAAKKVITETQLQTALDNKGNLTPQAKQSLKDILSQVIFQGGNNNIRKQFNQLPKAAQKALLQTIARELDSNDNNGILSDIQEAIEVFSSLMQDPDFKAAKGKDAMIAAAQSWAKQMQMDFTEGSFVPEDRYSNFAIALAVSFKADTMKEQSAKLNQLYDYLQAEGGDIFNPAVRLSKDEAVRRVYGVETNTKENEKDVKSGDSVSVNAGQESTDGGQGISEGATDAQRDKQDLEQTNGRGAVGDSQTGVSETEQSVEEAPIGETEQKKEPEKVEVTAELIDSLPIDDVMKSLAKQYLKGKVNSITTNAFKAVEDYVQNESRNGATDSANADTTQLGGTTDDASVQTMGADGGQGGSMDRGQSDGDVSAERPSGEDSQGGLFSVPGEGSDSGVEQPTSDNADNSSAGRTDSSRGGSKRGNVRKSSRPKGSRGVSADAGRGESTTEQSIDDKIQSADDLIADALAEIKDILRDSSNTLGAFGNADMFKLLPATAKLGYALTKKGYYTFKKWFAQMQKNVGPLLQKHFTIEEIDELIRDMWDTEFTFGGETHTVQEWASMVEQEELRKMVKMNLEEKVALQKSRENVETIVEDLDNIRESLPFLLPQQQEDVLKAETQFFSESHKARKYGYGKGILFTNGTGTGKTYTGLGIVKRFVKQGKGRILIVTAQDKKIKDWIRDASNLGIEATQLKDTKDKGKGVVVTQFANMYQNRALLEDEWDLIVYDESHKLMESKDGRITARAVMHHMLSNRDLEQAVRRILRDHELFRKEYELRDELEYLNELFGKNLKDFTDVDKANYSKYGGSKDGIDTAIDRINAQLDRLKVEQNNLVKQTLKDESKLAEAQKAVDKTKVVFLSASPFNTAKNLDYVENYIFSYNPEAKTQFDGEFLPSELRDKERDNFVLEKFPSSHYKLGNGTVQMRSEQQINNPEQSSQEEIDFSESLQKMGTLSGRTLDSEWDYSRQFPKLDFPQARIFNEMYQSLVSGKYAPLMKHFKVLQEYNLYTEYFEAIKTALSLDRIKAHVALGRKVVVFHRRRSNTTNAGFVGTPINDAITEAKFENKNEQELMREFIREFADYLHWEKNANLDFANYKIAEAFATEQEKEQYKKDLEEWDRKVKEAIRKGSKKLPDRPIIKTKAVVAFNGSLSEKTKRENADFFNDDKSDVKVIVAQVASAKEGVDFHDKTGGAQRAEVNLYLPESPIEFIQAEGRIYRIGNKSNAVFEYPLLGIDLELASFAMKINGRAQTSENLALGNQSRGLRNSISRAALSSRPIDVTDQQGIGGKQLDSKTEQRKDDFDDAIRNYAEWKDSQPTELEDKQVPDPIGERMATWAMPEGGDTVLVPFAGEGSVARYVDPSSRLVAYEANMSRFARLAMLCGGSGRKIENKEYLGEERYNSDNILFFKPRTAPGLESQDVIYGLNRLGDSGRMVILTTDGKNLKEKLSTRYRYDTNFVVRAEIKLSPSIMGINKNSLELIVIDNLYNEELQRQAKADTLSMDLSEITDETQLWEAIRGIQVPNRIIDNIAKTRKRAERALDNYIATSPFVKKRTQYNTTGKNKLVPDIRKDNTGCSFSIKGEGYVSFRYSYYTPGNPSYSIAKVQSLAEAWQSRQEYIKNNEKNPNLPKYIIERIEGYKAMCNFIEALLGKTPPQLRNLALGMMENVVTGEIDIPTLKDSVKGMLKGNAALERLNDRVMKVAESFGIGVEIVSEKHSKFDGKSRNVQGFYSVKDGKIWIKDEFINSVRHSDEKKAEVLLHEAIHSVTCYALEEYRNGNIQEGTPMYNACKDIFAVYEAIKQDPVFVNLIKGKDGLDAANNEYGLTDVDEMMAELANPAFRAALKAKKLWRQLVNGIKMLLGIQIPGMESTETNALNVLENALEVLLDNADVNTFNRTKGSGLFSKMEFNKTSKEIESEYPNWLDGTTNENGKHSTQVAKTVGTYNKVGEWIENNLGKDVEILDASSGMGLGTQSLREKGFNIEDVEPYQSEDRKQNNPATYSDYADIDKQYDYIISNAVLNVIPDDWRADVLHNMAARMKDGGKMFINTRKAGEEKSIKDKIELDIPQEVLVKRNGRIASYQRFFTPQELKSWVEQELGDGYSVEVANEKNSGTKGLAAVVVTKNNAIRYRKKKASDTALPGETPFKGTVISNADETKVLKNLDTLAKKYKNKSTKNARTFIGDLAKEIGATSKGSDSKYATFRAINGTEFTIRLADHNATVSNFDNNGEDEGISIVISRKGNEGITNDGNAHIVEYFYNDKKLRNADGHPLVEIIKSVKQSLYSGVYKDNTGLAEIEEVNERLYRQSVASDIARQHSEEVMQESIDKMAQDLGVNAEYVSDAKQSDKKGWYEPATGKVVVNLAAHETIDDARQTYLHEVVGHFGLRGLLKDKFEKVMNDVFNSLPKDVQEKLLAEYKDKTIAAEEYLSEMAENDIRPSLVQKILGFIREALREIGIISDNFTNGDLQYLLWRSKNNLRENAGVIEAAKWGAKNKEIRYRTMGRPAGYSTNKIEMSWFDKRLHEVQDRMRPVKLIMDEIINRGGTIDESSDVHSQEFLSTSRAAAEIEDFKNTKYEPLAKAIAAAMKVFTEKYGMLAEDAREAVDLYLYARHAPERNKQICVNEIVDAALKAVLPNEAVLVTDAFKAQIREVAKMLYDNQFRGGKNVINPTAMGMTAAQAKLAISLAGTMQKKASDISKQTAFNEETGVRELVANNRSGMSDQEAEDIMNRYYTPDTASALDEVSAKVKECTDFTLDKWLEYGLISKDEYNAYKNQYEYYIPLRGWDDTAEDINYMEIPTKQFNQASELINLNRKAEGRLSKAANPLAHIASLAQSACVTGNRNLIRQKAFNMIANNETLASDLAVIENTFEIYDDSGNVIGYSKVAPSQSLFDQGRVKVITDKSYRYHKTGSELGAHRVPVMIDGVRHTIYFKGKLGALAATAINGTENNTRNVVTQNMAKATRFISSNLTAKNIYFLGKNLLRDLGFGNFAYFVENGAGKTLKLNGYFFSAMRTAAMDAMGADKTTYKDADLYEEFKLNGGQTGYVQLENIDKLGKQMEKLISEASKNRGRIAQEAVNAKELLIDTFDVLGKASENAMRFAVYKMERERGASPREAAIRAKEVTVNFNRQGTKTKGFSAVYAFFNPAVQGAYRYFSLAYNNPVRFAAATAGIMALKFGLGLICELFSGGEDDEPKGESAYDRLSDYVKATNYVIPLGWLPGEGNDEKFLCIPMPQSVRGTTYASDLALDVMFGRKDFGEAVKAYASFNVGEFVPFDIDAIDLGGDNPLGSMLQAAAPTTIRPVVEAIINRDFMGNPIRKTPYLKSQDYIPQHQLGFASTSPILVGASEFLNKVAGGDDKRSAKYQISQNGQVTESGFGSFMDVNPATLEHLFSGYFGGMFKPVVDVWDTMTGLTSEDVETNISSVALVNQFIKGPTSKPGYKKFYEMRDEAEGIDNMLKLYKEDYLNPNYIPLNSNRYNAEIRVAYKAYSDILRQINDVMMIATDKQTKKELQAEKDALILEAANYYRDICNRRDKEK